MPSKPNQLPKHIAQMVEKNNLVMAIKTLAEESNMSISDAKVLIDNYEAQLKTQQDNKVKRIAAKQRTTPTMTTNGSINKSADTLSQTPSNFDTINAGLDQHLDDIGYKKPLVPYWAKRIFIIFLVIGVLSVVFWQLLG